ncbi:NAD(P)/FAD-dependent oxidoreductase [Virgibacillus xinjiangensis]|uniref:NAD(P)/FAD-dependent oxidoreductase n=1 Tax=Virgibacillus xinjiangensis TaxID=393090 RepID=A0ABV7CZI4_9BACI
MKDLYDVTIVGGGPAGLYSAFYSGECGLKTKILEAQSSIGGKITLYPKKKIWDAGKQSPVSGGMFAKRLVEQVLTFQPTIFTKKKVELIEKRSNTRFVITTDDGVMHYSKAVILANGDRGDTFGCTTQEGIFAAGDNICSEGKVNSLAGAKQDALRAVNSVKKYINSAVSRNSHDILL